VNDVLTEQYIERISENTLQEFAADNNGERPFIGESDVIFTKSLRTMPCSLR